MIWNASPILLSFGPFQVHWYGFLFALGFFVGAKIAERLFKKEGFPVDHIDRLVFYMIVGTLVGARLAHTLIYEPEIYLHDPIRIFKIWEGGLASHGGTLGVILGTYFWKRKYWPGTFVQLLDIIAVPSAMVGALIRIGNFFNSEIIGHPTAMPWGIVFQRVDSIPRHPTMLYECIAYLFTFAVLAQEYKKGFTKKPGFILGTFFFLIFGIRFWIEFFKEYQVPSEAALPLDLGQLLSIPFVIFGAFLMFNAKPVTKLKTKSKRHS